MRADFSIGHRLRKICSKRTTLLVGCLLIWTPLLFSPAAASDDNAAKSSSAQQAGTQPASAILLVPGMSFDIDQLDAVWGHHDPKSTDGPQWSGMIGYLQARGMPFGGTIRSNGTQLRLPEALDRRGTTDGPTRPLVFALEFSKAATTDGLAFKALELARAIAELKQFTGCRRVSLVAHSAGGVIARTYLQSALPGVSYHDDVDRLITIGTPHMGSAVAERFGDLLGTRATSLRPDAELIRLLNDELDLPPSVRFASIVVRGVAADVRGDGNRYDCYIDTASLEHLPVEFRTGGDQAVHVKSQNLSLTRCAARYEKETGLPVQFFLARVPDPSPSDWNFAAERVHLAELRDPEVGRLVRRLLVQDSDWDQLDAAALMVTMESQAALFAWGAIEEQLVRRHATREVTAVDLECCSCASRDGTTGEFTFRGQAASRRMLVGIWSSKTDVAGKLHCEFDRFGRIRSCRYDYGGD